MRAAFLKTRGSVSAGTSDLPTATAACAALRDTTQTLAYVPTTEVALHPCTSAHLHPRLRAPPRKLCTRLAPPRHLLGVDSARLACAGRRAAPITRRDGPPAAGRDGPPAARREPRPVHAVQPAAHRQFGATCICPRRRVGARQIGAR